MESVEIVRHGDDRRVSWCRVLVAKLLIVQYRSNASNISTVFWGVSLILNGARTVPRHAYLFLLRVDRVLLLYY